MSHRFRLPLSALFMLFLFQLTACGQKGPLYLPDADRPMLEKVESKERR